MTTSPLIFMNVAWMPPGREAPVFSGLDLVLEPGAIAAITSPLGGGKSSALRMAVGLERPSTGVVRVCGQDPASCPAAVRGSIGFAPAEGALLSNLSLWDNLVLPLRFLRDPPASEVADRAAAALALFGLDELPRVAPAYAPTNLRRLVALARAMILEPQVLVVDDPTDDFDEQSAVELWSHLAEIAAARKVAILAAATRPPPLSEIRLVPLHRPVLSETRRFTADKRRTAAVPALRGPPIRPTP